MGVLLVAPDLLVEGRLSAVLCVRQQRRVGVGARLGGDGGRRVGAIDWKVCKVIVQHAHFAARVALYFGASDATANGRGTAAGRPAGAETSPFGAAGAFWMGGGGGLRAGGGGGDNVRKSAALDVGQITKD